MNAQKEALVSIDMWERRRGTSEASEYLRRCARRGAADTVSPTRIRTGNAGQSKRIAKSTFRRVTKPLFKDDNFRGWGTRIRT